MDETAAPAAGGSKMCWLIRKEETREGWLSAVETGNRKGFANNRVFHQHETGLKSKNGDCRRGIHSEVRDIVSNL